MITLYLAWYLCQAIPVSPPPKAVPTIGIPQPIHPPKNVRPYVPPEPTKK